VSGAADLSERAAAILSTPPQSRLSTPRALSQAPRPSLPHSQTALGLPRPTTVRAAPRQAATPPAAPGRRGGGCRGVRAGGWGPGSDWLGVELAGRNRANGRNRWRAGFVGRVSRARGADDGAGQIARMGRISRNRNPAHSHKARGGRRPPQRLRGLRARPGRRWAIRRGRLAGGEEEIRKVPSMRWVRTVAEGNPNGPGVPPASPKRPVPKG